MNYQPQNPPPTFESVWAALMENREQLKKTERLMEKQFAENERQRQKSEQEWKEKEKKSEKEWADFHKSMKAMQKELGGVGNSNGAVAESYFVNSFTKTMQFAGQKYDSIDSGLKRKVKSLNLQGEYDLVLYNCTSVVIIEIKYDAEKKHVEWLLEEAAVFKQLFPQYANFDLYIGLAALHSTADIISKFLYKILNTILINPMNGNFGFCYHSCN